MNWEHRTPGIPESCFVRGEVPITKMEIRVLSIAKLRINEDSRLLDIGCGTGSITVEAALQCPKGKVIAMDSNEEAFRLTSLNVEAFGLKNTAVFCGKAPQDLPDEIFDRIFVGGGGKDLTSIISYAQEHLTVEGIIVINTILLESTFHALTALEACGFKDIECIQVGIARGEKVSGWMMKALNPIYIISACR